MSTNVGNATSKLTEYERLEHSLWMALMRACDCCNRLDKYPAPLEAADDPTEWAKIVAPLAEADGWTAPGICFLLCPSCRAANVDWQSNYTPMPSGGVWLANRAVRESFQRALDRKERHGWLQRVIHL